MGKSKPRPKPAVNLWDVQPPSPPLIQNFSGKLVGTWIGIDGKPMPPPSEGRAPFRGMMHPGYTEYLEAHKNYVNYLLMLKTELKLKNIVDETLVRKHVLTGDLSHPSHKGVPYLWNNETAILDRRFGVFDGSVKLRDRVAKPPVISDAPLKVARRKLRAKKAELKAKKVLDTVKTLDEHEPQVLNARNDIHTARIVKKATYAQVLMESATSVGKLAGAKPLSKERLRAATLVGKRAETLKAINPAVDYMPGVVEGDTSQNHHKLAIQRKTGAESLVVIPKGSKLVRPLMANDVPTGSIPVRNPLSPPQTSEGGNTGS